MTLFSNYTNFGTVTLFILGAMLFVMLCLWRNLPTNLDTLLKSLWRLSGRVAVTWAIFVLVLIGTAAYAILLLINHLGTVGTDTDHLRQIILAIPVLVAALAALIALPVTLIRLHYTRRQTLAEEEGLITDRINAAILGLGAEKTVKVTEECQVIERTEPNIEVRIGAILALERIAQKNLDVHVQIMEMIIAYVNANAKSEKSSYQYQFIATPRQDVQIAFDMIGRRTEDQCDLEIKLEKSFKINDAYLVGLNLENHNCENLEFHRCDLSEAGFPFFTPDRIFISCCNLSYAHIYIGEYGPSKEAIFSGP